MGVPVLASLIKVRVIVVHYVALDMLSCLVAIDIVKALCFNQSVDFSNGKRYEDFLGKSVANGTSFTSLLVFKGFHSHKGNGTGKDLVGEPCVVVLVTVDLMIVLFVFSEQIHSGYDKKKRMCVCVFAGVDEDEENENENENYRKVTNIYIHTNTQEVDQKVDTGLEHQAPQSHQAVMKLDTSSAWKDAGFPLARTCFQGTRSDVTHMVFT